MKLDRDQFTTGWLYLRVPVCWVGVHEPSIKDLHTVASQALHRYAYRNRMMFGHVSLSIKTDANEESGK